MIKQSLSIICILQLIVSCDCHNLERRIMDQCEHKMEWYDCTESLMQYTQWDRLYILDGPLFEGEVSRITGTDFDTVLPDHYRGYYFVKNGQVNQSIHSHCTLIDWSYKNSINEHVQIDRGDRVSVRLEFIEGTEKRYHIRIDKAQR